MPWSDWQDSEPYDVGAARLAVRFQENAADGVYTTTGATTSIDAAGITRQVVADPPVDRNDHDGMQYAEPVGWADERNWFPDPLYGLEYGVQFGIRPDRTGSEDDAYVEYEDGTSTRTDWVITGTPQVTNNTGFPTGGITWTWSLGVTTGTSYVLGTGNPIGYPGAGSVFATIDHTTPAGTALPSVPDMGQASSFFISAQLDAVSLATDFQLLLAAELPRPFFRATQPRWRYWIPGEVAPKPLRQRQRDDGLGLSPARWRAGRSRQSSNRWSGYL